MSYDTKGRYCELVVRLRWYCEVVVHIPDMRTPTAKLVTWLHTVVVVPILDVGTLKKPVTMMVDVGTLRKPVTVVDVGTLRKPVTI